MRRLTRPLTQLFRREKLLLTDVRLQSICENGLANAPIAIAPIAVPATASPTAAKPTRAVDFEERFVSMRTILPSNNLTIECSNQVCRLTIATLGP
jgi:hypothetical protein